MEREASQGEVRLTNRDRELLGFVAEHRLVLASHVQALLGVSASAAATRLRALSRAGFLEHRRLFHGQPACYRIRPRGLAAIGSEIGAPRIDLHFYEHDLGVVWLWLAARHGRFGPVREIVGERRLRSQDASERRATPCGVRLGGVGPGGRERLHYPDLLLVTPAGQRIAVELELSAKGRSRREGILAGYGADRRIDAVLYLVKDRRTGQPIRDSARRLGIGELVHVQQVRWAGPPPGLAAGGAAGRTVGAVRAAARPSRSERVR